MYKEPNSRQKKRKGHKNHKMIFSVQNDEGLSNGMSPCALGIADRERLR